MWRELTVLVLLLQLVLVTTDEGSFWHVTDIHYDFSYEGRQLSCRDHKVDVGNQVYGDYWCDSPWSLVNTTVHAMANIKQDVDFIIWTGDTVVHASDADLSYAINAEILDNVTTAISSAFPNTQMYPTFGNHDYWPSNQFPPNNNDLYNETFDQRWNSWIGGAAQDEDFRRGGYYTMLTSHGLRIVALNTNLYYTYNKQVTNNNDPAGQFVWLNKTLAKASADHEKVLVTGHIPPGVHTPNVQENQWLEDNFNTRLVEILQTYTDVIVGMHFGHDHADSFKVLLNKAGSPGAPIFISPSVTPWRWDMDHNPAVRLIKYDRRTGKHIGIQQYYLDLPRANQDGVASWKEEYSTEADYRLSELTAASLLGLSRTMKDERSHAFKNYWKYFAVSTASTIDCDQDCHASIICGITEFHLNNLKTCKTAMISEAALLTSNVCIICSVLRIMSMLFYS